MLTRSQASCEDYCFSDKFAAGEAIDSIEMVVKAYNMLPETDTDLVLVVFFKYLFLALTTQRQSAD